MTTTPQRLTAPNLHTGEWDRRVDANRAAWDSLQAHADAQPVDVRGLFPTREDNRREAEIYLIAGLLHLIPEATFADVVARAKETLDATTERRRANFPDAFPAEVPA